MSTCPPRSSASTTCDSSSLRADGGHGINGGHHRTWRAPEERWAGCRMLRRVRPRLLGVPTGNGGISVWLHGL